MSDTKRIVFGSPEARAIAALIHKEEIEAAKQAELDALEPIKWRVTYTYAVPQRDSMLVIARTKEEAKQLVYAAAEKEHGSDANIDVREAYAFKSAGGL